MRAPADAAELVLAAMLELAPGGVEQVDGEDTVEFAVYGAPGELPELDEGEADVGGVTVVVSGEQVPDDWAERWKRFHAPILIADRLYVRPPWEEPPIRPGVVDIQIDPGRAFGTGAHATTRLCLELLLDLPDRHASLCDLGCGSGVLSIAAAKLGHTPIEALDSDRLAIDATQSNARDNGIAIDVVRRANLRDEPPPAADIVLANLMRPLLFRVADLMTHRPNALIASGLLDHEADEIAAAFHPLTEQRRISKSGWSALLLS
ncbi:MAG: 50S ribosomal protein L11 methyltransferase [Thermoleophilaceae bacterium]